MRETRHISPRTASGSIWMGSSSSSLRFEHYSAAHCPSHQRRTLPLRRLHLVEAPLEDQRAAWYPVPAGAAQEADERSKRKRGESLLPPRPAFGQHSVLGRHLSVIAVVEQEPAAAATAAEGAAAHAHPAAAYYTAATAAPTAQASVVPAVLRVQIGHRMLEKSRKGQKRAQQAPLARPNDTVV